MAGTLDQSYTTNTGSAAWAHNSGTGFTYIAQQVVIGVAGDVSQVDCYLKKTGTPTADLTCEIWSDSGDSPNAKLSDSQTIAMSSLTTSLVYRQFDFSTQPTVGIGDKIWIVMWVAAAHDTNYPSWGTGGNGYAGTAAKWSDDSGSTWSDRGFGDANFKQYYIGAATSEMFLMF